MEKLYKKIRIREFPRYKYYLRYKMKGLDDIVDYLMFPIIGWIIFSLLIFIFHILFFIEWLTDYEVIYQKLNNDK